ncbi:hypothetical protein L227DRAFT_614590 [Lentinus tigrinus ALCF2SS1-6]|uniref:Thioesterase domain-containing protein n=1 Tax=Lentinus tigrinus ALCF2SS1-6 TaxID=1328759 RepID=A0A5C2RZJ0_9APHY|nr:hypothetical protein L227DRAFT_614590 [Lentinus tigrinus ALCF2SS1-6]
MTSRHPEVRFSSNLSPQQRAAILDFEDLEDRKVHARVVFEIDMAEDMLNARGNLHGGCTMHLIDICTTTALMSLKIAMNKEGDYVSQAVNTVFHAPAKVGARLEIINTTTAWGSRSISARTEIWDITNRRLIATGIQNQMQTSRL